MFLIICVAVVTLYLYLVANDSPHQKSRYTMETEDCPSETVPSLLVDSAILSSTLNTTRLQWNSYCIGDEVFYELPENNLHNDYVQFEMRAWRRSNIEENLFVGKLSNEQQYVWTPDGSSDDESENGEGFMDIHVKDFPNGVIVNSNVYLTLHQWHTLIPGDVYIHCFVCDDYFSKISLNSHIKSNDHKQALNSCKPLVKYELSITREIRNKYHCGTCNMIVEKVDQTLHYESESHENNMLTAINKVSDFVNDDDDIEKDSDESADEHDDGSDFDADDENCDNEWVKALAENPGASYANKLKKNYNAPEYYDVDLGGKRVRVTHDCWHMIIKPKENSFYCMVCKEYYRSTLKNEHCANAEHLDKLKRCSIVDRFGEYFIRQVDEFYHCGRCNSLQLKGNIEEHLEYRHNRKPRKVSETTFAPPETNSESSGKETKNISHATKAITDTAPGPSTSKMAVLNGPHLYKDVLVNYFDLRIFLPFLNYHVILKNFNLLGLNYCCALCDFFCNERCIPAHTQTVQHIQRLQQSPFILPYSLNMIRYINGAFHCALCNVFVLNNLIYIHIQDPYHIQMMNKILNTPNNTTVCVASINKNVNDKTLGKDQTKPDLVSKTKELHTQKTPEDKYKKEEIVDVEENKAENLNVCSDSSESVVCLESAVYLKKELNTQKTTEAKYKKEKIVDVEENKADNFNVSCDSLESVVDLESAVYLKLNSAYLKITFTSFNTLVPIGDGNRHCFVCNAKVDPQSIKKHVESRIHVKNINECYFLDMCEGVPLRQVYTTFHCGICNALMPRSNIKDHLVWTEHTIKMEATKLSKRVRKIEIKSGTPVHEVKIAKEIAYEHHEEPASKILRYIQIVDKVNIEKKYKMISINEDILKVPMSSWHSVVRVKQGYRCSMCQKEMKDEKAHVKTQEHLKRVHYPFVKKHLADLIREVNNNILHCVICNAEVANVSNVILTHIGGKKHKKKYIFIKEFSANTNSYSDCDSDFLQL
ncbi:hypothetical protein evm_010884 [Chilo suppressalis]|nr:hypothetical protein evm_010884 [Chilo suppressalis]